MANFIEYASLAQDELNKEKQVLAGQAEAISNREAAVVKRSQDLDKREADIATKEKAQADRQAILDVWESNKRHEEDVQKMFDEANAKLATVDEKLKVDIELNNDTKQKLEELAKQSHRLSDEKQNYRDEIKKELIDRVMKGQLSTM